MRHLSPRLLLAALALLHLVRTAVAAPTSEQISFQRFTPRDGLPAAVVYCAMQDHRGFMWFGTADGVARFDGHEFRVFRPDPADPESLANAAVLDIQEDADGDLWMATEGGLDVWRRNSERFAHYRHDPANPTSLSDDATQCLLRAPDGILWVGTRGGGLNRFDPRTGQFEHIGSSVTEFGSAWVRCLHLDRRGQLWVGTNDQGLYRVDPATRAPRHFDDPTHRGLQRIAALTSDASGALWIGTEQGPFRFDPESARFEAIALTTSDSARPVPVVVTAILVDRDGQIGFGTDGHGYLRYDPRSGHCTPHRRSRFAGNSLAADAIRAAFEAPNGDIWLGHFPNGVSHHDRSAAVFSVYAGTPGEGNTMSDDQVLSFLEDPSGDLWVGTDNGGLNHWSAASDRWTSYCPRADDPHSLGAKAAISLLRDHDGVLWVGTWGGGLNRLDETTGRFRRYLPEPGNAAALSDTHVWRMIEDPSGDLWIATIGGGLNRLGPDRERFAHYRHDPDDPHSLNDDIVSALLPPRDGTLWAGTPKGLARFDRAKQRWDRFVTPPGAPGTLGGFWIFDLCEAPDGSLWITTEGGGLNHLDPRTGRCENFRTRDGLPSDVLRGLVLDDDGALWIGSNRGLVRFDPATRHHRVFDESNGLPGSQFNPHARLRLRNGEFLFGTTQGFVRFDPRRLGSSLPAPPIVLTRLEIFNVPVRPGAPDGVLARSITETTELEIPAELSVIRFQFAALTFAARSHLQYRVKLEGFDRDWRNLGAEPRATFTNLDPGRYLLRVVAMNGDGPRDQGGVSLALTIVPRWWQTWWFRTGCLLGILGSASAVGWAVSTHRLREEQHARELTYERERAAERERTSETLRQMNQQLEARVADRTAQLVTTMKELEAFSYSVSHDLRAPLRSMDGFSRVLLDDYGPKLDDEARDSLRRIRAATQRMGQLIDDLLMLSRVSRDEMKRSAVDLSALAATIADELRLAHPEQSMEFVITPGLVADGDPRLLRIALENLLGNARKFSSKRALARIEFGASERDGQRWFYVRDNGAGFDPTYATRMFEAFRRFHTPNEFPGSGIGLATVQRIIRRHGGTVTAESQPDAGATFFFTLPDQPNPPP
jgi:signal transduction histidine kinase/ligand-binding sensor domain-containing protein